MRIIKIIKLNNKSTIKIGNKGNLRWCGKWGKCKVCHTTTKDHKTSIYRAFFNKLREEQGLNSGSNPSLTLCTEHLKEFRKEIDRVLKT